MQTKIRVGAVSYLNTKPLIYGFQQGMMKDEVDLVIDYPSKIASMLLDNTIDIGLVPVAIIPEMKEYHIISDYCIGCDGQVASVCLFSEVPLEKIKTVLLDYQSRTSIELLKILIKDYWKVSVVFQETTGDYQTKISGTTAALVIGDRALKQRKISPFIYDLGAEWKKYTALSFVFAAWISNKKFDKEFVDRFNEANAFGLKKINDVIENNENNIFDLAKYYGHYINFELDEGKEKGMNLFLQKIKILDPHFIKLA